MGAGGGTNHHRRHRSKHPHSTPSPFDGATAAAEADLTVSAHSSNPDSISSGGDRRKNSNLTFLVTFPHTEDAQEQNSGREGAIQQQTDETNTNSNLWFHRLSVLIQSIFPGSRTIPVSTASSGGGGVVAIAVEIQGESEQHSLWSGRIHNNHSIQQPCHSNEEERQQLEDIQQHLYALREQLDAEWMVA